MRAPEKESALSIMEYIPKDKFDTLTDSQIEEQIELRQSLIRDMVGWLYPSILTDEIVKLRELLSK